MRLAQNTTDLATAQHLTALAAEHTKLAEQDVGAMPEASEAEKLGPPT